MSTLLEKQAKEQQQKILKETKKIYDDGKMDINKRSYPFVKMPFKEGRKVYAYFTSIQTDLMMGNLMFMESQEFLNIRNTMFDYIDFDGNRLNAINDNDAHFEKYPEDYDDLISSAMLVFAYPFLKGKTGK